MKRKWFQKKDGTYFRNCSLIEQDRYKPINWLPWRARALAAEWAECWDIGLIETETIGRRDKVVTMRPFRETYPDRPGLWVLDDE